MLLKSIKLYIYNGLYPLYAYFCGVFLYARILYNVAMTKHEKQVRILKLNLAYYRKLKGLTQEQLAELVDIGRSHISNIEAINVSRLPSYELLFNIADKLNIPVSKFFEDRL